MKETLYLREGAAATRDVVIQHAAAELRQGRLVVFPTETVYGLGAGIFNERAVQRIFTAKGRPADNPLIVHVASPAQAVELMAAVPPYFDELVREFWPGPLTLVVRRNAAVFDVVTAGLGTVAIRMPAHPIARRLIEACGMPVAAPSANRSGRPSPTTAPEAFEEMRGRAAVVIDGGPCRIGIESTVLDLTSRLPTILRPGSVTFEDLMDVLQTRVATARPNVRRPASPGMKYQHYAPDTPVVLVVGADPLRRVVRELARARRDGVRTALLAPASLRHADADAFFSLRDGSAVSDARLMYRGLRALDAHGCDRILVPGIPADGVGAAVMNRLRKASAAVLRS